MTILLLTGPPASGKTTVVAALASRDVDPLAVIELDTLRQMVVRPHLAPWDGEEGRRQQLLGIRNACALARTFDQAEFDVLLVDQVTDDTAARYRDELALTIVRLLPNWEQTMIRSQSRDEPLGFRERELLYVQQQALETVDITIDNSTLTPSVVAGRLQLLLSGKTLTP